MRIEIPTDSKGRMLIPKSIRKALGIEAGKPVSFLIEGDRAIIKARRAGNAPRKGRAEEREEQAE